GVEQRIRNARAGGSIPSCGTTSSGNCHSRKPLAIGLRGRADPTQEAAAHGLIGAEAAVGGHALHGTAEFEQTAGRFQAELLDRARRRAAGGAAVVAHEAALA